VTELTSSEPSITRPISAAPSGPQSPRSNTSEEPTSSPDPAPGPHDPAEEPISITNLAFNQPISISSLSYNTPISISSLPGSPKISPTTSPKTSPGIEPSYSSESDVSLLEDSVLEKNIIDLCNQSYAQVNEKLKEYQAAEVEKSVEKCVVETEKPVSAVRPVQQVKPNMKTGDTSEVSETPSYIDIDNSKQLSRGTGGTRRSAMKKKKSEIECDSSKKGNFPSSESLSEPSIEGPEFSKEFNKESSKEKTPAAGLGYIGSLIMDSPYHPGPLLLLIYFLACLVFYLPYYITGSIGIAAGVVLYKFSPPHPKGDKYKVQ